VISRVRELIARATEVAAQLKSVRPVRAAIRYNDLRGNRLAGAVSFYGFISVFPLLALSGSVVLQVLGPDGVETLQEIVDESLPGLEINVSAIANNAGTIGLIGAVTLLWTGLAWVDATRASVRSMWRLDDAPGNFVTRKLIDLLALLGLGVVLLVSWGGTVVVTTATDEALGLIGADGEPGRWVSRLIGLALALASSAVLFGYLLAGLPRIGIPFRVLLPAAVLGGLVFELLKQLIAQFAVLAAPNSTYAAFAVPLALIGWIYIVTRLLMLLAASTAEWAADHAPATTSAPSP
jgi:membrane protein